MNIKNNILNTFNFILLLLGNINLLGAFTLIETDILGTIFFGIISILLLLFSIKYFIKNKNEKTKKRILKFISCLIIFTFGLGLIAIHVNVTGVFLIFLSSFIFIYNMIKPVYNAYTKNNSNKILTNNQKKLFSDVKIKPIKSNKEEAFNKLKDKFLDEEFIAEYDRLQHDFFKEAQYYNNWCCPNCGVVFDKPIKTSRNCSACKKRIIKRSNYLTKQNYLIGEDRIYTFINYQEKIGNLRFYEDKFRYISMIEPEIKKIIRNFRKKQTIQNVRELFWNICNDLSSECIFETTKLLKKVSYADNDEELIHKITSLLFKDNIYRHLKIKMVEYEKKDNLLITLVPQYIYGDITANYIQVKFDKFNICNMEWLYKGIDIKALREYLENYNMSLTDFKEAFMTYTDGYPIHLISKEEAWKIIENAFQIQYSKL